MTDLKTELLKNGDTWHLKLVGYVNASTSHAMWTTDSSISLLSQLLASQANRLVIDLSETKLIDSHGLRLLIDAQRKFSAESVPIMLKNPNAHMSRLFRIMQFDRLFTIETGL